MSLISSFKIQHLNNKSTDFNVALYLIGTQMILLAALFFWEPRALAESSGSSSDRSQNGSGYPPSYGYMQPRDVNDEIRLNRDSECSSLRQEVSNRKSEYQMSCAQTQIPGCEQLIETCFPGSSVSDPYGNSSFASQLVPLMSKLLSGNRNKTCPSMTGSDYNSAKSELTDRIKDAVRDIHDAQEELSDRQTDNQRSQNDALEDQNKLEKDAADEIADLENEKQDLQKESAEESQKIRSEILADTAKIRKKNTELVMKIKQRVQAGKLLTDDIIRNQCLKDLVQAKKDWADIAPNTKNIFEKQAQLQSYLTFSWNTCIKRNENGREFQNQSAVMEENLLRQEIADDQRMMEMKNEQLSQITSQLNQKVLTLMSRGSTIQANLLKSTISLNNKINALNSDTQRMSNIITSKTQQANAEIAQYKLDIQELGAPPPRGATESLADAAGKLRAYKSAESDYGALCRRSSQTSRSSRSTRGRSLR